LPDQLVHIEVPARVGYFCGVSSRERTEVVGQLVARGHSRAADEHRHDQQIGAAQRDLDLDPDGVVDLTQPRLSPAIASAQPVRSDHHEDNRARAERALDRLREILARPDRGDVVEDVVVGEVLPRSATRRPAQPAASSRR